MALTTVQRSIIAERRQMVSRMRCRQLTEREIEQQLDQQGHHNPDTGGAWSHGTIHGDIMALEAAWREASVVETNILKGIEAAELREVKRRGWEDGNMDVVLKASKQICSLFGLDAPTKIAPTDPSGEWEYGRLSDAELGREIARVLATVGNGPSLQPGIGGILSLAPPREAEPVTT